MTENTKIYIAAYLKKKEYWKKPEYKAKKAEYDKKRRLADPERKRRLNREYYMKKKEEK